MATETNENVDPESRLRRSKLPQTTTKIPSVAASRARVLRPQLSQSAMRPPSQVSSTIRGRSMVEVYSNSRPTSAQTGPSRSRSASSHNRGQVVAASRIPLGYERRTTSNDAGDSSGVASGASSGGQPSSQYDMELWERMQKLENSVEQERKLNNEINRLKTERVELDLEKKMLDDRVSDLKEQLREDRERYRESGSAYKQKIESLEEKVAALAETNSNLKVQISESIMNLKDQCRQEFDVERERLTSQWEIERARLDQVARDAQDTIRRERDALQQERTALEDEHERELTQLQTKLEADYRQELQNMTNGYSQEISRLQQLQDTAVLHERHQLEVEKSRHEELMSQANLLHTHKVKHLQDELELQSKRLKLTVQELDEVKDKYESQRHEAHTLRNTLSELSESTVSQESVSKSQQTRIQELEYQLESQREKSSELRLVAQRAEEERDVAKDKLLKEELIRRKLHNQIQELKGNIRVFCRVRPSLSADNGAASTSIEYPDIDVEGQQVLLTGPSTDTATGEATNKLYQFSFDKVFSPAIGNGEVYEEISQLVQSALDGYNVCIFAYGQTGSGKTYTMSTPHSGMIPLAVNQIFSTAKALKEKGWQYTLEGQFLEIYNETLNDLLAPTKPGPGSGDATKLDIRHDTQACTTEVVGLTTVALDSPDKVAHILKLAWQNRSVAATKLNERSSRSHSVFILKLSGVNTITGDKSTGVLNLIDLAGSERVANSQVTGDRLRETKAINKSLSCLGDVIYSLGSAKEGSHVPYRNSKLTYLLQYSLSGNSKTLMFVNISPLLNHVNETLSSLRFATKVNNTQLKKAKA